MATEQNLVLSRFIPLETERLDDLKSVEGPMTILIVVSSPEDQPRVIAPPVIEAIQNLAKNQEITVVVEKLPTVDRFQEVIQENRPHVLHFLGHGEFDETKQAGKIALLADDERQARWVPDRLFAAYFTQMEAPPRLVFLHSCEGGANQFSARFAGLAPQLVRNNVQAVIAMQYPIQNKAAILFSKAFYRELLRRAPVDSAAQSGRYAITNDPDYGYESRVFGTPMLWMRSRSGMILPT
jgi:CHAT domain-containing protein